MGTDNGILAGRFNRKIGGKSASAIYYTVTGHSDIGDRRVGEIDLSINLAESRDVIAEQET
jgi:hypothetical protein